MVLRVDTGSKLKRRLDSDKGSWCHGLSQARLTIVFAVGAFGRADDRVAHADVVLVSVFGFGGLAETLKRNH